MALSFAFGLSSLKYNVGEFSKAGPGLFPLVVSCILLLIGLTSVIRSRFVAPVPMKHSIKNITLVLSGLCGFAILSEHLNMIAGILFLVFCVSFAGASYSIARNLKISAGLIAIGFVFRNLLGLQLPLL